METNSDFTHVFREDSPPQNFEHAELQTDGGARNGMLAAERLLKDPVNSSVPSARSVRTLQTGGF